MFRLILLLFVLIALPQSSSTSSSWLKRRTDLEKLLLFLLLLSFIVVVTIVTLLAVLSVTAARIMEAMDETVEPCSDFFEYACGTWNRANTIPDDRPNYNTFRKLDDQLQANLKVLLETPVDSNDIIAIKNAKWLYQSCVNMSMLDQRKEAPLLTLLDNLGGWPVLNQSWTLPDQFNIAGLLARLKLLSHVVLVNLWVSSDDKHSTVNIIQIDQANLGLPSRDYFLKARNDRALTAYQTLAINIAQALGATEAAAKEQIPEMIDFEIQLAKILMPEEQRRDNEAMYNKMTIGDLYTNLTNKFDWLAYMQTIFRNVSIELTNNEPVVVYTPQYMRELFNLLDTVNNRTLVNYIMWHVVMNRMHNLHQGFLDLRRDFNKAMLGTEQERARWRTCTTYVNENFGMAVGRMYIEKHFDERAKSNAVSMIQNIRRSFSELLQDIPWMSADTKKVAQEKADTIQEKIGYPDYIKNNTALNLDYEHINLSPATYFENILNILHISIRRNIKQLRLPVDRDKWSSAPTVVNAFYSATRNQIMFPAAILQPPFYHENYPMYLNFGGIAMIIGHEITHGFDDKGRMYDKDGNMKQWWSEEDIVNFKVKAQCIIDQYTNYTVEEVGLNLNGKQTQGENIADNGGLKQAYKAYKHWTEKNGRELTLPGIQLTDEQLFFLSFAQMWCGTSRPEHYTHSIRTGKHSPGKLRVIGSLSNSDDFARAFNCPPGSRLNPTLKCNVW